jgi:hypothetical protein
LTKTFAATFLHVQFAREQSRGRTYLAASWPLFLFLLNLGEKSQVGRELWEEQLEDILLNIEDEEVRQELDNRDNSLRSRGERPPR